MNLRSPSAVWVLLGTLMLPTAAAAVTTSTPTAATASGVDPNPGVAALPACEEKPEPTPTPSEIEAAEAAPKEGAPKEVVSDGSAVASDAEIEAYRGAAGRFRERAREFAEAVGLIVQNQYEGQVRNLRSGYERLYGKADLEEKHLREEAISAHEKFIADHPSSIYTPRRMFRLAELYFEDSEEAFLAEIDRYAELEVLFDQGKVDFLPEPPLKDYRKSIALYKRVIADFPKYEDLGAVYYMLGYSYSDESGKHLDPGRAREVYSELLANVPDSAYRAQAYFRLADLHFEENDFQQALGKYKTLVEEMEGRATNLPIEKWSDTEQRFYEQALYKLAWTYYKLDNLDVAINEFVRLIDWADRREAATGKAGDLKTESLRYLAISIADRTSDSGESPIEFALATLNKVGERPWTYRVLAETATVLTDQARFVEAIGAYEKIQERYPLAPEGPEFQNTIVALYQNLPVPDKAAADRARVELTNRYGLDSRWYEANRNNKAATGTASQYILDSLQWVAYNYHLHAQETGAVADYLLAAKKYEEYLERYPFAKNANELNFNLADCYFYAEEWDKAIDQYRLLFGYPEKEFKREAYVSIMSAYSKKWRAAEGDFTQVPEALGNIKPAIGQTPEWKRLAISDLSRQYMSAIDDLLKSDSEHPSAPTMLYDVGQIYYYHNHLPEARKVFEGIVARFPNTRFADFSAGLIVDSYLYTGQLQKMRESATRFAHMQLGEDQDLAKVRNATFATLERQSLFKEGEIAFEEDRFECALQAFEEYYKRYGAEGSDKDTKNIDLVVYNLAQSYAKVGNTTKSNELFELLLDRFPHSVQAPATFWKMASNYERILQLEKAVKYYDDLLKFHPGSGDAMNALFNVAYLKIGLKRFSEAATTFERYHKDYAVQDPEAKKWLYRAAELHETSGDRKSAVRVYRQWMDTYGTADPDGWVDTQKRLADFSTAEGKQKDADKILTLIDSSYATLVSSGLGPRGIRVAAEIHFQPVIKDFLEYEKVAFTGDPDKDAAVVDQKLAWNEKIVKDTDAFIGTYPDFLWQSAALYYQGLSFLRHAESWVKAPIPADVEADPDLFDRYVALLQAQAEPLQSAAAQKFQLAIENAKAKKGNNEWVDKAQSELNRVDPNTYPVYKKERSTVIPSDDLKPPPPLETLPVTTSARSVQAPARLAEARR